MKRITLIVLSLLFLLSTAIPSTWAGAWSGSSTGGNSTGDNTTIVQATGNIELRKKADDYISYWRFDENSSSTVSDENTTSANKIIFYGNWTAGKYGSALHFDGVDDYGRTGGFAANLVDLTRNYSKDMSIAMGSNMSAAWERNSVGDPFIVKNGSTYYMFYSGHNGTRWRIGYATNGSADLSTWIKRGSPVLGLGKEGAWDSYHVIGASLLHYPENSTLMKYNGTYWMAYEGNNGSLSQIGLASSTDLINWKRYGGSPVITANSSYDDQWAGDPYLFYDTDSSVFYILYSAKANNKWSIALANSTDMQNWVKENSNPVFSNSTSGFDDRDVGSPAVLKNNGTWYLFYSGCSKTTDLNRIGVAYGTGLFSLKRARDPIIRESGSFDANGVGDPAVISDGYETYVFYNAERFANGMNSTIVRTVNYNPLFVSFWARINDMGNFSRWMAKGTYAGTREWLFTSDPGVYKFSVFKNGVETSASNYEALGTDFHYFTGIYNGSYLLLYRNGSQIASTPLKGRIDATSTEPLFFGLENGTSNYLNGSLDEIRIYNRETTSNEIRSIMNNIYYTSGSFMTWQDAGPGQRGYRVRLLGENFDSGADIYVKPNTSAAWTLIQASAASNTSFTIPSSARSQKQDVRIDFRGNQTGTPVLSGIILESIDDVPPEGISNLQSNMTLISIHLTWTKPYDTDFNYTMIYLDGTWQANTTNNYYNLVYLKPGTEHTISTKTVDIRGNINSTWVNSTCSPGDFACLT